MPFTSGLQRQNVRALIAKGRGTHKGVGRPPLIGEFANTESLSTSLPVYFCKIFNTTLDIPSDRIGALQLPLPHSGDVENLCQTACGGHHSGFASICVDLYLNQRALDTSRPAGKLVFQITGAFAEFERSDLAQALAGRGSFVNVSNGKKSPEGDGLQGRSL